MVRLISQVSRRAVVARSSAGSLPVGAALPTSSARLLRAFLLPILEEVRVRLELEDEEGDVAAGAAAEERRRRRWARKAMREGGGERQSAGKGVAHPDHSVCSTVC